MTLFKALSTSSRVRRAAWPTGVHVIASEQHRIGSSPVGLCDIESRDDEPPGMRRYLTLRRDDPRGRVYAHVELSPGVYRPEHAVVHFEVPDWQPSLEDLFASDWLEY